MIRLKQNQTQGGKILYSVGLGSISGANDRIIKASTIVANPTPITHILRCLYIGPSPLYACSFSWQMSNCPGITHHPRLHFLSLMQWPLGPFLHRLRHCHTLPFSTGFVEPWHKLPLPPHFCMHISCLRRKKHQHECG